MDMQPGSTPGTYDLIKDGKKFGQATFWEGYDRPVLEFDTPPGLTPLEEQQVLLLPNPWKK